MIKNINVLLMSFLLSFFQSCAKPVSPTAKELFEKNYKAICYGGYRHNTRDTQPTLIQIKEDLKILAALDIKWIRTYNVHLAETENILKAIRALKKENKNFEMYLMLGAWIDAKNAWTELPVIHNEESERNAKEIDEAVRLANLYPDIVKVVSVGNEAMVDWATKYYVTPDIILKWVKYLQKLKENNKLSKDLWITSSDNFASWGGEAKYHNESLKELAKTVDYISLHTYPMHDTHYNPIFWGLSTEETALPKEKQAQLLMNQALEYAKNQYKKVADYLKLIDVQKPIHIGETGWASFSMDFYGDEGSMACDEYKQGLYYQKMMEWSQQDKITIFFFEGFDEHWKDSQNPGGSENHFGLFALDGQAKFALWNEIDRGLFKGLNRDGHPIIKTFGGDKDKMLQYLKIKYKN